MAELASEPSTTKWTGSQSRAQYFAIAQLRWRILLNGFRRKGGSGDLAARIISIPLIAALVLAPTIGSGLLAWYFAANGNLAHVSWLLWGIFVLSQMVNLNLGQPGTTFDPTELIRFPMHLRSYVAIRLFFGLLAPGNVVAAAMSFAALLGICIVRPNLWFFGTVALSVFALTNVLFTRMIFSWVDRWMSTRRAREIFTALIFVFSLGFQYLNFSFNPVYSKHHVKYLSTQRIDAALRVYQRVRPALDSLPPGLTGKALIQANRGHVAASLASIAGCALFAAAFLTVFALRMRTEFGGENLSDTANGVSESKPILSSARLPLAADHSIPSDQQRSLFGIPSALLIVLSKEFRYVRRNSGVFYGLVAPLVMVLLFASKLASHRDYWIFPAALAYTLLGLAPFAYNSFGLEGPGIQFYFLAPIRLRDVVLAKNFMNFMMAICEGAAVLGIITYLGARPKAGILLASLLWTIGTMLINITVGNFRSVDSPKKINLHRTSGKQASPLSALVSLGVLFVASGFGAGLLFVSDSLDVPWLLLPVMAIYAVSGVALYLYTLRSMDRYMLEHRENLFEELCKQS